MTKAKCNKYQVKINSYPEQAEHLVKIWNSHCDNLVKADLITFVNKRPESPKSDKRRIAGIEARTISWLEDDRELVGMTIENYIYLMAKCGIDITVEEAKDD